MTSLYISTVLLLLSVRPLIERVGALSLTFSCIHCARLSSNKKRRKAIERAIVSRFFFSLINWLLIQQKQPMIYKVDCETRRRCFPSSVHAWPFSVTHLLGDLKKLYNMVFDSQITHFLHFSICLQRRAGNEDWTNGGKNSGKKFIRYLLHFNYETCRYNVAIELHFFMWFI